MKKNILEANKIFSALSGDNRLKILLVLSKKAMSCNDERNCDLSEKCCNVTELVKNLNITMSTTSHHLKDLRNAKLIIMEKSGKEAYCSINKKTIDEAIQLLENLRGRKDE